MADYKYTVKKGDTLSELSQKFYGAMKYYPSIADHNRIKNWNGGAFWTATIEFHGTMVGGNNLMGTPGRQLYEDYAFWIRTAIRWLFLKFFDTGGASWETAVKAYNGSGSMAEGYKNRVISRVSGSGPVDASM